MNTLPNCLLGQFSGYECELEHAEIEAENDLRALLKISVDYGKYFIWPFIFFTAMCLFFCKCEKVAGKKSLIGQILQIKLRTAINEEQSNRADFTLTAEETV